MGGGGGGGGGGGDYPSEFLLCVHHTLAYVFVHVSAAKTVSEKKPPVVGLPTVQVRLMQVTMRLLSRIQHSESHLLLLFSEYNYFVFYQVTFACI